MIAWAALVVMLIGVLLWNIPSMPRLNEAGKILFAVGALVVTLALGTRTVRLF